MKALLFFIKQLSQYRSRLFLGIALSLTLALSSIALLSLSGWFISSAAFAGLSLATAIGYNYFIPAASIRLLAFIRILSRYFDRVINHDFTFQILADLRIWFYKKLIPLSPAKLTSHHSADLLNHMVNDIDTLDQLYLNTLSPFVIACLVTLVSSIFVAYFSPVLSLLILTMMLCSSLLISFTILLKTKSIGHDIQHATAELRKNTIDFIQGFVDLLLFVKKENRFDAINHSAKKLAKAQKKLATLKGFSISSMQLLSGLSVFLLLWLGIPLVDKHQLNGAELTMIVLLVIAAFEQLSALPLAFLSLGKTMRAAERMMKVMQEKPAVIFNNEKSPPSLRKNPPGSCYALTDPLLQRRCNGDHQIHINHLSFKYPNKSTYVFQAFDCIIPANTQFGISGPSGSGKSTLAYLLARAWDPDTGNIFIGDKNIKDFSENELRETISLVTQHVHIFNASVRDNLTLMRDAISDDDCFTVLEKVELLELIQSLPDGINTMMGEFGKNFSGGQIRRIAIARALLINTPIIILDEPSAGLESALTKRIWKNCGPFFQNKTVIVLTHDEALLAMMSHSITLT